MLDTAMITLLMKFFFFVGYACRVRSPVHVVVGRPPPPPPHAPTHWHYRRAPAGRAHGLGRQERLSPTSGERLGAWGTEAAGPDGASTAG